MRSSDLSVGSSVFCRKSWGCKTISWIHWRKKGNTQDSVFAQHSHMVDISLCNIFKQEWCTMVGSSFRFAWKSGDLQIMASQVSSLLYLGRLFCSWWGWRWYTRGAKTIEVTKIPETNHNVIQDPFKINSLGVIEIILKVNFNHPEESPASEEWVGARLG